jgi:hypothetical protein
MAISRVPLTKATFMAASSRRPRFSARNGRKAPVRSNGPWLASPDSARATLKKAISVGPQYRSRKNISMRDQTKVFAMLAAQAKRP